MGSDSYNYNIESLDISSRSYTRQTIKNRSFVKQENNNAGVKITFQDGIGTDGPVKSLNPPYNLYGVPGNKLGKLPFPRAELSESSTTLNGYWGNKNQEKINFNKNNRTDAYSLGINIKDQKTIPTYNLRKNTIQNFTLPNGQTLLSFLKENKVQTGNNVQIKITKDGVKLQKTKLN